MAGPFEILIARIETLDVDAVVNAANRELLAGTGVDGAIRAAAGPELTQLTQTMAPLGDGEARLTPGFRLSARHIIHVAAPIWTLPGEKPAKVAGLAACYRACIEVAGKATLSSIAFPCLGTGNFGWPRDFACAIAVAACEDALAEAPSLTRVVFCCFSEADASPYRAALT
jgi:O-acetyl-ADP-ribose deacetylase (regulator of RNase III)